MEIPTSIARGRCRRSLAVAAAEADAGGAAAGESLEQPGSSREAALRGGRGRGVLAFYADHFVVPLPEGHRFPMDKYRATRTMLENDASLHGSLIVRPAPLVSVEELLVVHDLSYVERVLAGQLTEKEQRVTGFPWSLDLTLRNRASTGGTVASMHAVMLGLRRAAATLAGGTHHAFRGHGEGFCIFIDISVAAAIALSEYPDRCNISFPILVIDLDVHQGNGTAKNFEGDDRVITFSMHGANNYPWRTEMSSDYDVELSDNTDDDMYLKLLLHWLPLLFKQHQPSLVFSRQALIASSKTASVALP
eukprot:SM000008S22175  [mRNA]  locus=s8:259330:261466:+ [translate_table: standard]